EHWTMTRALPPQLPILLSLPPASLRRLLQRLLQQRLRRLPLLPSRLRRLPPRRVLLRVLLRRLRQQPLLLNRQQLSTLTPLSKPPRGPLLHKLDPRLRTI